VLVLGLPWLVGFFGLLVRLYIGSGSQFRFLSHLSPECYILLQLQNPTYRCWCCLLAVSAAVGTGVLFLCILFVFYRDCIGSVRISPLLRTSLSSLISSPSLLLLLLLLPLPLLDLLLCPDLTVVLCFRLSLDLCSFVSLRHYQLLHDQQRNTKTPRLLVFSPLESEGLYFCT
jgi:hypothetical protein